MSPPPEGRPARAASRAPATSDVRVGGAWTPAQRLKNDLLLSLVTLTLAVTERLSPAILRRLGHALGGCVWALAPGMRRLAIENVARALPELDPPGQRDLALRAYRALGGLLGDTVATLDPRRAPSPPLPFLPGSLEVLREAHAEGRGVVFASAHLGPWERVAATVAAYVPLTVVAREPYDPRLAKVYARLREDRGVRAVYRGGAGAGIALVRVLRRGGVLAIPMDLATRAESIEAPFLGVPAPSPVGPARLALRTGAAVVVGTVAPCPPSSERTPHRQGGALALEFVRVPTEGRPSGPEVERALTGRINEELSRRIRALPELWPWIHRRWPRASSARR